MGEKKKILFVLFITVFTLVTIGWINTMNIQSYNSIMVEDEAEGKPEGTGYTFDDFGKGLNLPVESEEEPSKKQSSAEQSNAEQKMTSMWRRRAFNRRYDLDCCETAMDDKPYTYIPPIINRAENKRLENKGIIAKVQNKITLEDKLTLLKLVKNLSFKDIGEIKNALMNGATNSEATELWEMLRDRLSNEDYTKLEKIIAKYE